MKTSDAIRQRRTIKRFTDRQVTRGEIEQLLDAATHVPNHKLTQPWRFYVLGPESREAYGRALGERKAKKQPDPVKGAAVRDAVAAEHRALPAMLAVAVVNNDDPEGREEDYAATMMAIHAISLMAVELDLGAAIRTGAIMNDPAARAAAGVPDDQRIIAIVNIGAPADVPQLKPRTEAASLTTWRP